jgi:predicted outer membrane protein
MFLRHRMSLAALAAGALAMSTIAVAQQREQPRQPNQAQPERRTITPGAQQETSGDASKADAQLAACLIIGNNKEVALAQFAQQHAQDPGVKEFAQQMIQDHEQFAAELQKFAAQGGYNEQQLAVRATASERATAQDQPGAADEAQQRRAARDPQLDPNDQATARRQTGDQEGVDFVSLKQEIAQQCLESASAALSEKPESEFDKCYHLAGAGAHGDAGHTEGEPEARVAGTAGAAAEG